MSRADVVKRYLSHLGIILCHLSILGVCFMLGSFISAFMTIFIFIIGLMIIVVTLGTIFLFIPDYMSKLTNFIEVMTKIGDTSFSIMPIVAIISLVCCIASIVLTAFNLKWEKARIRFIISCVLIGIVIFLFAFIIAAAIGGSAQ